jgi:oxaloacetate decarboxylase gamma subunit
MQESLLSQGLDLMVYGMGAVFVFLALLIVVTSAMSKLVAGFFPEAPIPVKATKPSSRKPAGAVVDPQTIQVISAAIQQHRARRSR